MPQHIEVPGMGVVEFPDGMDDASISAAIMKNMQKPQQDMIQDYEVEGKDFRIDPITGAIIRPQKMDEGSSVTDRLKNVTLSGMAKGVYDAGKSALTLPSDVAYGKVSPTSDEAIQRSMDVAGFASPVNPAVRAGDMAIPGARQAFKESKPVVPTTQELQQAGAADLNAARNSGLEINGSALGDFSRKTQQDLYSSGIHPVQSKDTFAILRELENAPQGAFTTANDLAALRETFGNTAQNFNPQAAKDQLAATRTIKALDEFIPNVPRGDVIRGNPAETAVLSQRGRGNYAAAMRSNDINGTLDRATTGILERAEGRAEAANSGRNLDNTIRQKVAAVLEKPKEISGLSDAEISALEGVRSGGAGRNTARYIGNLLGGGGGFGQAFVGSLGAGIGAATTMSPWGAVAGASIPSALGAGAKSIANALAKRDLRKVDELLRKRSPLYEERAANPGNYIPNSTGRSAIIRALLAQQQGAN